MTSVSVSVMIAVTGMTVLAMQRSDRRQQTNIRMENEVSWCARAGLDLTSWLMEQEPLWRNQVVGGYLFQNFPVGNGTVSIQVFDDADGNITNKDTDPVRVVSIGQLSGSTCKLQARLSPRPHPALNYAMFAGNDVSFSYNVQVRGPVRAHQMIVSGASTTTWDDAYYETMTGYLISSVLSPKSYVTTAIASPTVDLTPYLAVATSINGQFGSQCTLRGYNLTPTHNPEGTANANGIYAVNAGGRTVHIEDSHIKGTLIVYNTGGHTIEFENSCWLEPGPLNYPVLIAEAGVADINFTVTGDLDENNVYLTIGLGGININLGWGVDFNEDGDVWDEFPSKIHGLVWGSNSRITMSGSWTFTGCAVARRLAFQNSLVVDNDPTLLVTVPPGFTAGGMRLVCGSVAEVP